MGIKGLNQFLRGKCPHVFRQVPLSDLRFRKGAVDFSLYVFKYKTIFGDKWLNAIVSLISCMRKNDIHVCCVYDTGAPLEKQAEREQRQAQRDKLSDKVSILIEALDRFKITGQLDPILIEFQQSLDSPRGKKQLLLRPGRQTVSIDIELLENEIARKAKQIASITPDDIYISKRLLDVLCVPWFNAPLEAETTCADFCKRQKVHVVFSEDSDVLCYGAPVLATKVDTRNETAVLIYHEEVLDCLGFTEEQFVDFCIMCGTDYNKNIPKIGPETAYKLLKRFGSIEGVEQSGIDVSILNHIRTREIFTNYARCNKQVGYCGRPDFRKVEAFFNENWVNVNMDTLKRNFDHSELMFD